MSVAGATFPSRLLVTGAAGYLGGAVVDLALGFPETKLVIGLDVEQVERDDPRFRPVVRDVRQSLDDVLDVDGVFHAAFLLGATRDEALARSVNVTATERLLISCRSAGVGRVVYPSSTTVYGAHPGTGLHGEGDPRRPIPGFRYAEHKVEVEDLLATSKVPTVALRSCIVLGPGARNFITESLSMRVLPVPTGSNPAVQFLHVDDFTAAVRGAFGAQPTTGVFNVAGSGTIRWREAVRVAGSIPLPIPMPILAGATEASWRLRLQSRSPAAGLRMIRHPWLACTDRIERDLGWRARYGSAEALECWARNR
jgi:nucleoside-diphosphate-sugar epimerase